MITYEIFSLGTSQSISIGNHDHGREKSYLSDSSSNEFHDESNIPNLDGQHDLSDVRCT